MSVCHTQILGLYRKLLRQGSQFRAYNYRMYTLRRVRDYFKEKATLTDPQQIEKEYQYGLHTLDMLKRQTALSGMYFAPKLVVEPLL